MIMWKFSPLTNQLNSIFFENIYLSNALHTFERAVCLRLDYGERVNEWQKASTKQHDRILPPTCKCLQLVAAERMKIHSLIDSVEGKKNYFFSTSGALAKSWSWQSSYLEHNLPVYRRISIGFAIFSTFNMKSKANIW